MALSSLAALLFVYLFMPALWLSIMSADDSLDAHEAGLALVASRMSPCPPCRLAPSHRYSKATHSAKQALQPTWQSLSCCGTKFKLATGSDVAPHIHDKLHEHMLSPPLAQKHPGCASGNHLGENSIT
ncbi:hypothetical protein M413DRAFT_440968, partial [Hebeloma cylindrosporum]